MSIVAIDLFCGAGGLTRGLLNSGINVIYGIDLDPNCQYAYEKNNENCKFIQASVSDISGEQLKKLFGDAKVRLLAGCAPCQPFSKYSSTRKTPDKKWKLLAEFERLVEEVKPELVTMENVPQVRTHDVFHAFVQKLKSLNYYVTYKVVSCPEYGLAQTRRRLVLMASQDSKVDFIQPTYDSKSFMTVKDKISHLPKIEAGQKCTADPMHYTAKLSAKNLKRIQHSLPGGTWRDWPKELIADCHLRKSGKTYASVYGRMSWDKPSPTMTTQSYGYGNGRFGHPEQDRALSLREIAILQSFPDDYEFFPADSPLATRTVATMIGNAVPVLLGEVIGNSFKRSSYNPSDK